MTLAPGQILTHYRLGSRIGAGGMGVVFLAQDLRLQRDVALKILPDGLLTDEAARKRFRREALTLSKLNHPAIATAFDFNSQEGIDFLVMEFVEGETLATTLRRGPLAEKQIARLGAQLADGMCAAHEHHVLHRDLKPANIRITPDGRLKILDFGLAKLFQPAGEIDATATTTQTQGIVGTLPYMSPEQLRGEPVDERTDIYAAGAVLYEMATGRRPFPETQSARLIDAILHQAPPQPAVVNPQVSPALQNIILKALDKEPERRFQSARELSVDLQRLAAPEPLVSAPMPRTGRRRSQLAAGLAVAVVALVALLIYVSTNLFTGSPRAIGSLAVLPFDNVSEDPEAEYLSDGITENLINRLAELPTLQKVIARDSVFKYKGRRVDPVVVGRELGVKALVTGRIVQRREDLAVSAALVSTVDSRHIWGEQYRRKFTEIFELQDELVTRISEGLRVELTGAQKERLTKRHTDDAEAYRLYLQGRFCMNQWTEDNFYKAIGHFERAIDIDPGYALAYSGLADLYYAMSNIVLAPREAMPNVKAAALAALELDENLGEAHASLGVATALYDWDWTGAQRRFERAIELNPGQSSAHLLYAFHLMSMGRVSEARAEAARAQELDPLSPHIKAYGASFLYFSREYEVALAELRELIEAHPDFYLPYAFLGLVLEQTGDLDEAIAAFNKAVELEHTPVEALAQLGHAYAVAGRQRQVDAVLEQLAELASQRHVSAYNFATIYAGMGRTDRALEWLEKAEQERTEWIIFLRFDPRFDGLRAEPRFEELMRRTGLPELAPAARVLAAARPRFTWIRATSR